MSKPKRNPLDRNRLRMWGYYLYATISVLLSYLATKGHAGPDELAAWLALGGVFGFTAGAKVDLQQPPRH